MPAGGKNIVNTEDEDILNDFNSKPSIDVAKLGEDISKHESGGNYTATNPDSSATGKYQFLWSEHGDNIKKITGVKTQKEFLNSPEAQEKYFNWHVQNNIIPTVEDLKPLNKDGYSDEQLARLIHFKGPTGAKEWLSGHIDRTQKNNASIDSYIGKPTNNEDEDADILNDFQSSQKKSPVDSAGGLQGSSTGVQNGSATDDWTHPQATVDTPNAPKGISAGTGIAGKPINEPEVAPQVANAIPTNQSVPINPAVDATNTIANHIIQSASSGAIPQYEQSLNSIPPDQAGNPLFDLTDPHGDHNQTGAFVNSRIHTMQMQKQGEIDKLGQEGGNENPNYQSELKEINDRYNNQIGQLQKAGTVVTSLQLANKAYNSGKLSPEESQKQLDDAKAEYDKSVANATGGGDIAVAKKQYDQTKATIQQNSKYSPVQLGMEQQAALGNTKAKEDLVKYNNGQKIDEGNEVAYQSAGLNILQTGAQNADADNNPTAAKELADNSDNIQGRLEMGHPKYFGDIYAKQIGSYLYNNDNNPLFGTVFARSAPDEKTVRAVGKKIGLSSDQIRLINPASVPTMASMPGQFAQSAFNSFLMQDDKGAYSTLFTGNMPDEQHDVHNPRGFLGEIASGAGTVAGFMGQAGLVGDALKGTKVLGDVATNAKRYETAANLIPLAASNYNNAYHNSLSIIGDKPEDELKRQVYALINATLGTALMSIDPATAIGSDALGATSAGQDLIGMIKKGGLESITKDEFKQQAQNIFTQIAEKSPTVAGHVLSQSAIMGLNKAAENVTDMIYDPKHRHGVMDNVGNSAVQGGISMFLPSLLAGINAPHNETPVSKSIVWDIGTNPQEYVNKIADLRNDGKISQDEYNTSLNGIQKAKEAILQSPTKNPVTRQNLVPEQRQDYAFNTMRKNELDGTLEQINQSPSPDKSQAKIVQQKINEIDAQQQEILNNAGSFKPVEKPLPKEPEVEASVATDGEKSEEAGDKKSLNNTEEDVSLNTNGVSQIKTKDNGSTAKSKEGGQSSTSTEVNGKENPDAEEAGDGKDGNEQSEAGVLKESVKGKENEAGAEGQPASRVKKRKWVPEPEDEEKPTEEANAQASVDKTTNLRALDKIGDYLGENKLGSNYDQLDNADGSVTVGIHNNYKNPIRGTYAKYSKEEIKAYKRLKNELNLEDISRPEYSAKMTELNKNVLERASKENTLFDDHSSAHKGENLTKELGVESSVATEPENEKGTELPLTKKPEFAAWDQGDMEGKPKATHEEIIKNTPSDEKVGGGESFEEFKSRIKDAWENLKETGKDKTLLITHSGVMKMIESGEEHGWDNTEDLRKAYNEEKDPPLGEILHHPSAEGEILVARHGESEDNADGLLRSKDAELTGKGQEQAKTQIADKLKDQDIQPSEIISSNLPRAAETADIVHKELTQEEPAATEQIEGEKPNSEPKEERSVATEAESKEEPQQQKPLDIYKTIADREKDIAKEKDNISTAEKEVEEKTKNGDLKEKVKAEKKLNYSKKRLSQKEAANENLKKELEKPETPTEQDQLKDIDLQIQKEQASQKIEQEKRTQANKDGDVEAFNKHNANWYKKSDKISNLRADREALAKRIENGERTEEIKGRYNKLADKIASQYEKNKKAHKDITNSSLLGLTSKIGDHVADFLVARVVEGVRRFGNIHVAIDDAIRRTKEKFGNEANELSTEDINGIKNNFPEYDKPPSFEPKIAGENKANADEILEEMRNGRPYEDVRKEIMDEGELSPLAKSKILNYIDWHIKDQETHNTQILREPEYADSYLKGYDLTSGEQVSRYLSGKTLQDVHGKDVQFDLDAKETQLQTNLVKDQAAMIGLAKSHVGTEDVLTYGPDMLGQIKKMPDGPAGAVKKLLAVTALNNELHAERIRLENQLKESPITGKDFIVSDNEKRDLINKRLRDIDKMTLQNELIYRDITSNASNVLNAAKANRIYRNTVHADLYADKILDEETRARKEETEKAMDQTSVPEKFAEEGAIKKAKKAKEQIESIIEQKEKSEAGKNVESDISGKTKKQEVSQEKAKKVVSRLKEKGEIKKSADERGEIIDKKKAEEKANDYLGGNTLEDLYKKAKDQTKKPC